MANVLEPMELVPLPPEVVNLLNDMLHGAEIEESLPEARRWLTGARGCLEAEAECVLSEADDAACQNALYLLRQIEGELVAVPQMNPEARPSVAEGVAARAAELSGLLRRIVRDRVRTRYTELEALDRVVVAGQAVLHGRGRNSVLRERLPRALATLRDLHADFLRRAPGLPDQVRQALGRGYDLVLQGLEDLKQFLETGRMPALEDALTRLRAGGRLLEVQARWQGEAPAGTTALPVGGEDLDRLVAAALRGDEDWRARREWFRREVLPTLARAWRLSAERLPVGLEARDGLLAEAEEALADLERAVESTDAGPMDLAEAARRLEAAVAAAGEAAMNPDRATGSRWHDLARMVAGAWLGTVPDLVLLRHLPDGGPEPIRRALEHLDEYFRTGDRTPLLPALEAVLQAAAEEPGGGWLEEEERGGPVLGL